MKVPVRYHFQWRRTTVGGLQRATWKKRYRVDLKSIALFQNCKIKSKKIVVVLKCKKCFFLRKLTKMSKLILCFSEIPKIFICVRVMQIPFLPEDWKKLSVWSGVLCTVFALEISENEAYRKQTGSKVSLLLNKVSTLEHYRFMQFPHCLMIICKYLARLLT